MSNRGVDIFKALGHPTRRAILRKIAEKGAVSYKELAKIEPKAGVLYHHLRLLGDLIYQDENKLYRLTDKGFKAIEFMDTFLIEPVDVGIHKYFTPRELIEKMEGRNRFMIVVIIYAISLIPLIFSPRYVEFFVFLAPMSNLKVHPVIIAIISWLSSALVIKILIRIIYQRAIPFLELAIRLMLGFMLTNISPLILTLLANNQIIEGALYALTQIFALLLIISAVSATAKLSLRKSGIIVITLHYLGIMTYLILLLT